MTEVNFKIGVKPELEWVPKELIDVDNNYQRELDTGRVSKILNTFHWDHFGAVTLARKSQDRFVVTDGQHRVKAAQLHPNITHIPAVITSSTTMQEEAANFLVINRDRKAVSTIERFWAGVAAGDDLSQQIQRVLRDAECEVSPAHGIYKPNMTQAVTAVGRSLKFYGDKATIVAIQTIRIAWPREQRALRGVLIMSLARLVHNNSEYEQKRMAQVLRPKGFSELTGSAEAFRKLSGGSAELALTKTLVEIYNKGLSARTIAIGAAK